MPSNLKKMVRARMAETGESYQTALRHVRAGVLLNVIHGSTAKATVVPMQVAPDLVDGTTTTTAEGLLVARPRSV